MSPFQIQCPAAELCQPAVRRLQVRRQGLRAPQYIFDARQELTWFEGFADVVVSAYLQAYNPVDGLPPRSQHDNGDVGAGAQIAAKHQTIFAREVQIQDDQVYPLTFQNLPHFAPIARGGDLKIRFL